MVAAVICDLCRPPFFAPDDEPPHCHGRSGYTQPGVLGGWRCSCSCTWENR